MKQNLDELKAEIEHYLDESGMAVFYGRSRAVDSVPTVYWDCERHPGYKEFIQAGKTAGAKLIVFHQRGFSTEQIEDAVEQLSACDLPHEEYRELERRLAKLRPYDGLICSIELSFDHEGRVFLFDLRTEWYEDFSEILDEIQLLSSDIDDDEDPPISGYFSRN